MKSNLIYLYFSEELYVYPYAFSSSCLRRNKLLDHTPNGAYRLSGTQVSVHQHVTRQNMFHLVILNVTTKKCHVIFQEDQCISYIKKIIICQ